MEKDFMENILIKKRIIGSKPNFLKPQISLTEKYDLFPSLCGS